MLQIDLAGKEDTMFLDGWRMTPNRLHFAQSKPPHHQQTKNDPTPANLILSCPVLSSPILSDPVFGKSPYASRSHPHILGKSDRSTIVYFEAELKTNKQARTHHHVCMNEMAVCIRNENKRT